MHHISSPFCAQIGICLCLHVTNLWFQRLSVDKKSVKHLLVLCGVCAGAVAAWGRLDKMAIENCICTIALAIAAVMAGSGHLQTLCLFRGETCLFDPTSAAEYSFVVVIWGEFLP